MSQPTSPDLTAYWQRVTAALKEKVLSPSLWRALERAQPILVENDQFVVGFPVAAATEAHLLMDNRHKNMAEQVLTQLAGRPLTLRVIEGTTSDDWQVVLANEREAARLRQAAREKPAARSDAAGWEGVGEQLVRKFGATQNRQLPNVMAGFLDHVVDELAKAYPQIMGDSEPPDVELRNYSRVLERLSDRVGLPAALIGYLVIQRHKQA